MSDSLNLGAQERIQGLCREISVASICRCGATYYVGFRRKSMLVRRPEGTVSKRRWLFLVLVLFYSSLGHAITLEQIQEVYQHKFDQLNSYRIRYTEHNRRFGKDDELLGSSDRRFELYVKDEKFGIKEFLIDVNTVKGSLSRWKVSDGTLVRSLSFSESDGKPITGRVRAFDVAGQLERYDAIGYQPLSMVGLHSGAINGDRTQLLPHTWATDIVSTALHPQSRVVPETEVVSGHECCVVEMIHSSGELMFRVWLGLDLDLAVVKRESYVNLPSSELFVFYGVEGDEYVEIAPRFFLPHRITERVSREHGFQDPVVPALRRYVNEYITTSLELNPYIPDSAFKLEFPNGIFVVDSREGLPPFLFVILSTVTLAVIALLYVFLVSRVKHGTFNYENHTVS